MKLETYLKTNFSTLEIKKPLFYNWQYGIRFEIGLKAVDVFLDDEKMILNQSYFDEAVKRVKSLFNAIFDKNDKVILVCQRYSNGRQKIKKRSICFQSIENILSKEIEHFKIKNIYHDDPLSKKEHWHRIAIHTKTKDIHYQNIFKRLVLLDFGGYGQTPEIYFINKSKNIILNLYDDRGLDIIAKDKESLADIYSKFNNWILDYDREKIDLLFKTYHKAE